ncbi:MAG: hypothetical protein RBT63_09825 [Bdellovibrionales bacterium]|jgi:hypothetical protein|nr:hypothetical protein [Bdellovibrionales bacterium]
MEKVGVVSAVVLLLSLNTACSSRPCREPRAPEFDQTKPAVAMTTESHDGEKPLRTRVYKPDGSRQCGTRKGTSPETMERELAGIRVYAKEKRADGLMHIQVCGSPTGQINIYEIDSSNLKQAEERGFKRWED